MAKLCENATWKGKNINHLEKEELLEVIKYLAKQIKEMNDEKTFMGEEYYDILVNKKLGLIR